MTIFIKKNFHIIINNPIMIFYDIFSNQYHVQLNKINSLQKNQNFTKLSYQADTCASD